MRAIAGRVQRGELAPDKITRRRFPIRSTPRGMPDPDLLIRTAGEMRVSNYLLWQISYAELWVTRRAGPSSMPPCSTKRCATSPAANGGSAASNRMKDRHDARPSRHSPSMIRTRVLVGSLLGLAAVGVLVGDGYLAPWFPCLFVCLMAAGVIASRELVRLFPESYRPSRTSVTAGVLICLVGNWYPTTRRELGFAQQSLAGRSWLSSSSRRSSRRSSSRCTATATPGTAVPRLGATVLSVAYLGLLPCFFVQIRLHRRRATRDSCSR